MGIQLRWPLVTRRTLWFLGVAFALLASGCSAASSGATDSTNAADLLPLDAVFIELFGTADVQAYRSQIQAEANQLVVTCMAEAGFEYQLPPTLPENPTETQLESPDFLLENGFGIVSTFRTWLESADLEAQQQDPNRAYLATLTAAEIDEFLLTLQGPPAEPGQLQDDRGCSGNSADDAYSVWEAFDDAVPNYTSIGEERDTHPDWLSARALWRDCMVEQGYDYSEPIAIASDVRTRMNEGIVEVYPDGTVPVNFDGERWVVNDEVVPLLDTWQQFELDAAAAHVACTTPLRPEFDAVEREVQQGFVDRNQAAIDELLDNLG